MIKIMAAVEFHAIDPVQRPQVGLRLEAGQLLQRQRPSLPCD